MLITFYNQMYGKLHFKITVKTIDYKNIFISLLMNKQKNHA